MPPTALIKKAIRNPAKVPRYVLKKILSRLRRGYFESYRRLSSIDRQQKLVHEFTDQDEFALIILDACRYDEFSKMYEGYLDGELQRVWASGRWTAEYVERTWTQSHNLTYINSAPVISDLYFEDRGSAYRPEEHISNLANVWQTHWEPDLETVPAEAVTAVALDEIQDGPTRLVAHYMQPHVPYIGEIRLEEVGDTELQIESAASHELDADTILDHENKSTYDLLELLENDQISDGKLKTVYRSNLEYVFENVIQLVRRLDCPVIITADHGEHLGEKGKYLHEEDSTLIRQVPWFTVSEDEIGTQSDQPFNYQGDVEPATDVTKDIEDRLESLGYV